MATEIDVILFDLGGVLLELGPSPVPEYALSDGQQFDLGDWFRSDTAIAFETGRIGADQFARNLIDGIGLDCSEQEFIDFFTAWPRALFPGVPELLDNLRARYRLALLTNTNELHWPRFIDEFDLLQRFDAVFASHLLGLAKPGREIFLRVSENLGAAPESILFVDDHRDNVNAAAALGYRARLVNGFDELELTLRTNAVL